MIDRVDTAPHVAKTCRHQVVQAKRRGCRCREVPQRDAVSTVLVAKLKELRRNFVERLAPANAFPFALATCADALHRPLHAIGIVGLSRGGDALLTDVALLLFWSGIVKPLRAENLPVFDDGFECTVLVVAPTRACGAHKRLFAHPTLPLSRSFVHDNPS